MKRIVIALVAIALATGFLGYTKSGRQLLNEMGLAAACGSDASC